MNEQGWDDSGITLTWKDLRVYAVTKEQRFFKSTVTPYKLIVNNACGAVKPGSLVAIMGGSGAGKTTLMSALAFREPAGTRIEGDIRVNGRRVGEFMHRLSGYMYQEDLFVGSLTVKEHLNFMARLRLDRRTSAAERSRQVAGLLSQLGLAKNANTRIGTAIGKGKTLSGGEKKRLSFATEMLTDPKLLFCDEPTTGLDSYSAQKLVHMMNAMADAGKTVICTIHQPSSEIFDMFHQLVLVADGRIAFIGDKKTALDFFASQGYKCPASYNPADFFIRTLATLPGAEESTKLAVRRICDRFAVSDSANEVDALVQFVHSNRESIDVVKQQSDFHPPFWVTKLLLLTSRSMLQVVRDPSVQAIRIVQRMVIGFVIGVCYLGAVVATQDGIQDVQGALAVIATENTIPPMHSVLALFPLELPLFIREHRSGLYSTQLYYISRIAAMLPGVIAESVLFMTIAYWLVGLRNTFYAFLMTALVATLTMNVSTACGIFFSTAFASISIASTFLLPYSCVLLITSGVYIKLSTLPAYVAWAQYISWTTYSNEALSILQWDGRQNITCDEQTHDLCLTDGEQILSKYSFSTDNFQRDLWAMLGLYFIFHLLGFLCLRRRAKK